MIFCWLLSCFKHIFDPCILFLEIVEDRNPFGFDAIQFFLTKQYFCLLITTLQNGTYTSPIKLLFKKNICCIHLKRKTSEMKHYNRLVVFLDCGIGYWDMLIIQSVFYVKLCWNTCTTILKFRIYEIAT